MVLVYITCPNKKTAQKLAKILLNLKLVACVNVVESESYYFWDKKINSCKEFILISKTLKSKFKKIEKVVKENHPYKIPAILMLDVLKVNDNYLKWLKKEILS